MSIEAYSQADLTATDSSQLPQIDPKFFDQAAEIVNRSRPSGMADFDPMGCIHFQEVEP